VFLAAALGRVRRSVVKHVILYFNFYFAKFIKVVVSLLILEVERVSVGSALRLPLFILFFY
jgi:hypothetical protein